jgi:hypothetical protein
LCEAARDPVGARRRRARAAQKYRPDHTRLLIVGEAPPSCVQRYFYFEDVTSDDWLFRGAVKVVLDEVPSRLDKAAQLARFRDQGVQLLDLKEDPKETGETDLSVHVDDLVRRARACEPDHIVLVKVNVYDEAFQALRDAGLPVVDERIMFPSTGRQGDFRTGMKRALKRIGWSLR